MVKFLLTFFWLFGALAWLLHPLSFAIGVNGLELDVPVAVQWSRAMQDNLALLEREALTSDAVIAMVNGFVMESPERHQADIKWVDILTQQLSSLLESRSAAAKRLADKVEELYRYSPSQQAPIYNSMDTRTWDTAFTSTLQSDADYPTNVSFVYSTVRFPDHDANRNVAHSTPAWSSPLDAVFRTNKKIDSTLTNQYFADTSGAIRAFPGGPWVIQSPPDPFVSATAAPSSEGYNARFEPWYVLGASGPKDVVIVLDISESMGSLYDVRRAAINVVNGLTSQDFVNIVKFNTYASVISCWPDGLVRGTEENKKALVTFLSDLGAANGKTNIEDGLNQAFTLLDKSYISNQSSGCQQVVLLLTDGITSAPHFAVNNKHNAQLIAYVLNSYTDTSPLQRLTCANNGMLVPVPNSSSAYITMGSYYELLSASRTASSPIWVGPYLNQLTKVGTVMTALCPCFDKSQFPPALIGVVGVDLTVEDLEVIVNNFLTMPSYAFVVNNEGEALAHPLLQPSATYTSHPLLFDIADLEGLHGSAEFLDVRRDIVSGSTGQAIINKLITQPRGYQHYEGYISLNVTAEYYYRRIIPDTSLSLGVVWSTFIKNPHSEPITVPIPRSNITHVVPDSYRRSITSEVQRSSFAVAAKGFCNPVEFLDTKEDDEFIRLVMVSVDQPKNFSCPNELLSTEARSAVQSTSHVDEVWNTSALAFSPVTGRFIATHYSGVLRAFPARNIAEKYDPLSSPWYRRGLAYHGPMVGSVPYPDLPPHAVFDGTSSTSSVIYFSKLVPYTITVPATPSTTFTYGVVGMTVAYQYFSDIFLEAMGGGQCTYERIWDSHGTRCFIMDSNGYMVTHSLFLHTSPSENESYIFVGNEEPLFAHTMMYKGLFQSDKAMDYTSGQKRAVTTYSVDDSTFSCHNESGVKYASGELYSPDCNMVNQNGQYFIARMNRSNFYLVILNTTLRSSCNPLDIEVKSITPDACSSQQIQSQVQVGRGYAVCPVRALSGNELESLRGIQKCDPETHAVLMGVIIPVGLGLLIVFLIWFVRRRRMRTMRPEQIPNGENSDNDLDMHDLHPPNNPNDNQVQPPLQPNNPLLPSHIVRINVGGNAYIPPPIPIPALPSHSSPPPRSSPSISPAPSALHLIPPLPLNLSNSNNIYDAPPNVNPYSTDIQNGNVNIGNNSATGIVASTPPTPTSNHSLRSSGASVNLHVSTTDLRNGLRGSSAHTSPSSVPSPISTNNILLNYAEHSGNPQLLEDGESVEEHGDITDSDIIAARNGAIVFGSPACEASSATELQQTDSEVTTNHNDIHQSSDEEDDEDDEDDDGDGTGEDVFARFGSEMGIPPRPPPQALR